MKPTKKKLLGMAQLHEKQAFAISRITSGNRQASSGHEISAYACRIAANMPSEEEIMDTLASFHRNACYPNAEAHELRSTAALILKRLGVEG